MIRVKICGIKTYDEAIMCINTGADAVGFLVGLTHFSEDEISAEKCASIISKLPPFITRVAVTHFDKPDDIIHIAKTTGADTIQLHSDSEYINMAALRYALPDKKFIRVCHISGKNDLDRAFQAGLKADGILLDTKTEERLGGTGVTHDWNISAEIVGLSNKPVILAGGLNSGNIKEAVRTVKPFAVDVNSGVEDKNGNKDFKKLLSFIKKAKSL